MWNSDDLISTQGGWAGEHIHHSVAWQGLNFRGLPSNQGRANSLQLGQPAHAYAPNHDRALSQLTIFGSKDIQIVSRRAVTINPLNPYYNNKSIVLAGLYFNWIYLQHNILQGPTSSPPL